MTRLTLLEFCELLGVEFEMDFDDRVTICFDQVPEFVINEALNKVGVQLAEEFKSRAQFRRDVFVGGPKNGESVGFLNWRPNGLYAFNVSRGKWAVYSMPRNPWNDRRAFFKGYATSERNGFKGIIEVVKE